MKQNRENGKRIVHGVIVGLVIFISASVILAQIALTKMMVNNSCEWIMVGVAVVASVMAVLSANYGSRVKAVSVGILISIILACISLILGVVLGNHININYIKIPASIIISGFLVTVILNYMPKGKRGRRSHYC